MKKNNLLLILSLLLFIGCHDSKNHKTDRLKKGISQSTESQISNDINDLLNKVLSHNIVNQYFHFEKEFIFIVNQNDVLNEHDVIFNDKRFILENKFDTTKPYIEFTKIEQTNENEYVVSFIIPFEGVKGELVFEKNENSWEIRKHDIVEH